MKRFMVLVAACLTVVALATTMLESKAGPVDNNQFVGTAKYSDGDPAAFGTVVKAYLGGQLIGQTTIIRFDGHYQIQGDDNDFPTGSSLLSGLK